MREAVICEPLRTPVGRYGGVFKDIPAVDLAALVIRELVGRTKIDPSCIDDVIFGQCYPNGEAPAIGRVAALDAGLGVHVPGLQLDRRCGSGLQAVIDSAMRIQTGVAELVIAGGAESMSQAEHYALGCRFGVRGDSTPLWDRIARGRITSGGRHHPVPGGMLETAENLRREFRIPREAQDELAFRSHARAVAAQKSGGFADEIVPVPVKARGGVKQVDVDEHPRADVSMEGLARRAGARGHGRLVAGRGGLRAAQRQRLGHLARAPRGRHGGAHSRDHAARARSPQGPLRSRNVADPDVDMILIVLGNADRGAEGIVQGIHRGYLATDRPFAVAWAGGSGRPRQALLDLRVPTYAEPLRALRAMKRLADFSLRHDARSERTASDRSSR